MSMYKQILNDNIFLFILLCMINIHAYYFYTDVSTTYTKSFVQVTSVKQEFIKVYIFIDLVEAFPTAALSALWNQ